MTITEFLEARIAEDEREANVCLANRANSTRRWKRMLAECAAKRAIIDSEFDYLGWDDWEYGCGHDGAEIKAGVCPNGRPECMMPIQQALATVYADHPDYLQEWALS